MQRTRVVHISPPRQIGETVKTDINERDDDEHMRRVIQRLDHQEKLHDEAFEMIHQRVAHLESVLLPLAGSGARHALAEICAFAMREGGEKDRFREVRSKVRECQDKWFIRQIEKELACLQPSHSYSKNVVRQMRHCVRALYYAAPVPLKSLAEAVGREFNDIEKSMLLVDDDVE